MARKKKLHENVSGIDIDKLWLWCCVIVATSTGTRVHHNQFSNDPSGISKLIRWLKKKKVTRVAFESTGVYWIMLYDKLHGKFKVTVGNPRQMKPMRGYKTDRGDGKWIANLLRVEAIKPSFIPPKLVRKLRLYTRQYRSLVEDRTRIKNRITKCLRQAGITLDARISDLFCVSGRNMIKALIERKGPEEVAGLGARLDASKDELMEALDAAPLSRQFRNVIGRWWRMLLHYDAEIERLWEKELEPAARPFEKQVQRLDTVHGVARNSAICLIGEIGVDMSVWGSIKRLASWAGVCPGNNASGGKRKRGTAPKGNKYVRGILGEVAWAAIRTKGSSFRDWYYSNRKRLGHKNKAAFAVGHKVLGAIFSVLDQDKDFEDACIEEVQKRARRVRNSLREATDDELEEEVGRRHRRRDREAQIATPLPV